MHPLLPKTTSIRVFASVVLVMLTSAQLKAEPFETVINNGDPQNRVDIVILGDGYKANELQKYRNETQSFIQGFFAQDPFREYKGYFNVHRIDVFSNQSGADHPERMVFVDTAFDATYNCAGVQRLICVNSAKVNAVVVNTLAPAQREIVFVIVNDAEYGGSGGAIAVTSTHPSGIEIILHEEGHSFGLLGDEYGGPPPPPCVNTVEPSFPNVTMQTQRALIKWNQWIDSATPIPTTMPSSGIPGLYEGAGYCDAGLYRPTYNSKMRFLGPPFEQINGEQLIKRIYNFVSPIDSSAPVANNINLGPGQSQIFSVSTPVPFSHVLNVTWSVDGQQQGTGTLFNLNAGSLSSGTHSVTVLVVDPTTAVRNDPNHLLNAVRSWVVMVEGAPTPTPTPTPAGSIQFSAAGYFVTEAASFAIINVSRSGDLSGSATVDYVSSDGSALQTTDYTVSSGKLSFAPNESSKTFEILIVDDVYAEGDETINLTLSNAAGATLGSPGTTLLTLQDNDTSVPVNNPIDDAQFFVRLHYVDFLSRDPDPGGLGYWTSQITGCGNDQLCIRQRRVDVSNAFFYELEFQQTGAYVYRLYRAAYGNDQPSPNPDPGNLTEAKKIPSYNVFVRDRARVVAGASQTQAQLDLANAFVLRPEFQSRYPTTLNGPAFVDALLTRIASDIGVDLGSQRSALVSLFDQGGRGAVLYRVADDNAQTNPIANRPFIDAEYNRSFVYTQYAGYLRRDSDVGGFLFWLEKVNAFPVRNADIQHVMVCAFITSPEYQQRFSPIVTRSNSECGP